MEYLEGMNLAVEEDDDGHDSAARADDDDEVAAARLKTHHDTAIVPAHEAQPLTAQFCCF